MMIFEFDESVEVSGRIGVVGLGALGDRAVSALRSSDLSDNTHFVTVPDEESSELSLEGVGDHDLVFVLLEAGASGHVDQLVRAIVRTEPMPSNAVVAIVGLPLSSTGQAVRKAVAADLSRLTAQGVTVIAVAADSVFRRLDESAQLSQVSEGTATSMAEAAQAIADLVRVTGEVNVDFADIRMVLRAGSIGFFASGEGRGDGRAVVAATVAIEAARDLGVPMNGARGCVINIAGGLDLSIDEVTTISSIVQGATGDDTEIVFGAVHDPEMAGAVRVSIVVTGFQPDGELVGPGVRLAPQVEDPPARTPEASHPVSANPVRVFLASPSDVAEERETVASVISELNLLNKTRWGTTLELVSWETHAVPGPGRPQEVVNRATQIDEVDVFVGLLWSRIGTPTGRADSGTLEEFERAYESWSTRGRPWIAFYFCDRPVPPAGSQAAAQLLKVALFREEFPERGLYFSYTDLPQFEMLFRRHLTRIVEQVLLGREARNLT